MEEIELLLQSGVVLPANEIFHRVRSRRSLTLHRSLGSFLATHELAQLLEDLLTEMCGVCPLFHAYARRGGRWASRRGEDNMPPRARHRIVEAGLRRV
jgi:hypothetical protein